jgi:hypothetical protein
MNHELLKQKMDKFFSETSSEYLISRFEKLGYSFIDINYHYDVVDANEDIEIINVNCEEKPSWLSNLFRLNKKKKQNLDKFEVFLCKLAIC